MHAPIALVRGSERLNIQGLGTPSGSGPGAGRLIGGDGVGVTAIIEEALRHHRAGRLDAAERLYRKILDAQAGNADALHYLGVVQHQRGRDDEAIRTIERAVATGKSNPAMLNNLGEAYRALGRLDEAVDRYRRALALDANFADAHSNLGVALAALGNPAAALESHRRAVVLSPGDAEASHNLGVTLIQLGRLDEAETALRRAVAIDANSPEAWRHLALVLQRQGRDEESFNVLDGLLRHAPGAADDSAFRRQVAAALRGRRFARPSPAARRLLAAALDGDWDAGESLAEAASSIVMAAPEASEAVAAAKRILSMPLTELPPAADLDAMRRLFADSLMRPLLRAAPVPDAGIEAVATAFRRALLGEVVRNAGLDDGDIDLAVVLAIQCFANEFVWAETGDEAAAVGDLVRRIEDCLRAGRAAPAEWVAIVGAYRPLHGVSGAERLLSSAPIQLRDPIALQIAAPLEERRIAAELKTLGAVADPVSQAVRAQYEENPYPRWLRPPPPPEPVSVGEYLHRVFPQRPRIEIGDDGVEILVAGCGTGREAIDTARRFTGSRVLGVDLSRASIAYATRWSRALGLGNVEYMQADILALGALERRFDVIESGGVLHHMADPAAGLAVLVDLLKSGGVIGLALYSRHGRKAVGASRDLIRLQGFAADADGIRRCRQAILALTDDHPARGVVRSPDFYATSACRDLLFHVQEIRFDIPGLARLLDDAGLTMLGFEAPPGIVAAYRKRFPDDPTMTDLARWQTFEEETPDAFARMYQFWARKPA